MAPTAESSHLFQKLKLDTAPHKPAASTFASIPRHDSHQNGSRPHSLANTGQKLDEFPPYVHHHGASHIRDGDLQGYDGAGDRGSDIESTFKQRTTSISFNDKVTLDSGNRLSLEEPLPKFPSSPTSQGISDSEGSSDQSYVEIPMDRRRRLQHHVGESRYPLLQTTVDDLAKDPAYNYADHAASLTSETTASSVLGEVQTPLETPQEYLLSPQSATSPIDGASFFSRRQAPQRARSYRSDLVDDGSIRRRSRRSSTARSGRSLSSMSPAASFLSRYKVSEGPLKPTEPDDEGQGIGYEGEYIIGKQIGFGGFSVVKEVSTIENGVNSTDAVKIVRKQLSDKSELENEQIQTQFDHEVEIWRFLKHPYILPLLRVYNTDFATYCITRLNKGGTLFDIVRDTRRSKKRGLDAPLAKRYTYQLASALRYLHNDVMVVHRDVKLENCLVDMTGPKAKQEGGNILLCDFGMADFLVSDQRDGPDPHSVGENQNIGPAETSTSVQGSLQYAAPELFNVSAPVFSTAADIWALGVVIFTLLTARLPFDEGMDAKTSVKIQSGQWDEQLIRDSDAVQDGGFEDALNLVRGCLDMDPDTRWTVNDVLTSPWLEGCRVLYEDVSRPWLADP